MIWSKVDFEREVRRQLIELESIRKSVPAGADAHTKLDKLEASHKHILRKLDELFPEEKAEGERRSAPSTKAFERYLKTVEQTAKIQTTVLGGRSRLRAILRPYGTKKAPASKQEPAEPSTNLELPSLDARCATCGKVLLSSILGGKGVVFHQHAWHHLECAHCGDGFSKPGALN
jgi:ribosomal protein S27E